MRGSPPKARRRSAAASWLLHLGAVLRRVLDERDHGALFSLEHVEAGLGEGLSRRLGRGRGEKDWGRSAVQDRAAPRREVVDESRGVGLRLGLGLLGGKRCQRAGGADSNLPVRLPVPAAALFDGVTALPDLRKRTPFRRSRLRTPSNCSTFDGRGLSARKNCT
jgi:hypothetical protein